MYLYLSKDNHTFTEKMNIKNLNITELAKDDKQQVNLLVISNYNLLNNSLHFAFIIHLLIYLIYYNQRVEG